MREDPIRIIVPIVVIDELDNLKQQGRETARWRAGYTLAVLDRVCTGTAQQGQLHDEDFTALKEGSIPTARISHRPERRHRLPLAHQQPGPIGKHHDFGGEVRGGAFSRDGGTVLVASEDGLLEQFPACTQCGSVDELARQAGDILSRATTMGLYAG